MGMNDSVKRQIIMEQSPLQFRTQLTLQGHRTYDNLRTAVLSYMVSSGDWSSAASAASGVPMEIDALTQAGHRGDRGGKGKSDHKGKKMAKASKRARPECAIIAARTDTSLWT